MSRAAIEDELRETIQRLIALPELNTDDLEFRTIMATRYAKMVVEATVSPQACD